MGEDKIEAIEEFIAFLAEELHHETKAPYVDWMQAKGDITAFMAPYLLKFKQKEGL